MAAATLHPQALSRFLAELTPRPQPRSAMAAPPLPSPPELWLRAATHLLFPTRPIPRAPQFITAPAAWDRLLSPVPLPTRSPSTPPRLRVASPSSPAPPITTPRPAVPRLLRSLITQARSSH